jgi:hypothetical protein
MGCSSSSVFRSKNTHLRTKYGAFSKEEKDTVVSREGEGVKVATEYTADSRHCTSLPG